MARREGLDSLYDESYGQPITQQVSTSQPRVSGTESLNLGVGGNQEIPGDFIITGMPDKGRVKLTPEGQYLYGSASFGGGAPQQLEEIVKATYGTSDPMQVRQMFQRRGAIPYGQAQMQENQMRDPESVGDLRPTAPNLGEQAESQFTRDILQQVPEEELLAQQYMKGKLGVGSYVDEGYALFNDDPKKKFQYEQLIKHYEKEFPERAIPMQVVGAITSLVEGGQALKLAGGLKGVQKTIQRAKEWYNSLPELGKKAVEVGGVTTATGLEGFMYGFGEGNTKEQRFGNAYDRAAINVITTIPVATAFPFIRQIVDKPSLPGQKNQAIAEEFGVSIETAEFIKNAYESGLSLEQMLNNIRSSGDQRLIAEANQQFATITDMASNFGQKAPQIIQDEIKKRLEVDSKAFTKYTDEFFGVKPEGRKTIFADIYEQFGKKADEKYELAYDDVIDFNTKDGIEVLQALSNMKQGRLDKLIRDADELALSEGSKRPFNPIRTRTTRDGRTEILDYPNLYQLDRMKRMLDKMVSDSKDISGKVVTQEGEIAQNILRQLRNPLKKLGGKNYQEALNLGQGKILTEKALDFGQVFLKPGTTLDDVIDAVDGASMSELGAIRQSVRNQIENMVDKVKVAAGIETEQEFKALASVIPDLLTPATEKKLVEILGKKETKKYMKKLQEMKKTFEFQAKTRQGSQTQMRKEFMDELEYSANRGVLGSLLDLNPKVAIERIRNIFTGDIRKATQEKKDAILDELAGFIVQQKGDKADAALNYLEQVRRGERLGKAQQNYLINIVKPLFTPTSAFTIGTQAGNLDLENVSP